MIKYGTEFIGTFFLVLTICLAGASGSPAAPLAIGSALMVMVYMGGHVSGAHYNPAVSLAVMIRGKLGLMEFICYVASQVAGAIVAAYNAAFIRGDVPALQPGAAFTIQQALLVESLFTFALALVVLNAATAKKTEGNSFYGLAIGFTITAAAFAGGPVSGGAFNPAVGIGITLAHGSLPQLWIYLVGPLVGGAAAAVVFRVQEKGTVS